MFYAKQFEHRMTLSPRFIGPNVHELVYRELLKKVEGSCSSAGYVVAVLRVLSVSQGRITLSGHVSFTASYEALVLKPQKGDVIDAPIISSSRLGFFAGVGPLSIFISNYQIPQSLLEELGNDVVVRLRVIGMKIDAMKVYAIGTLNEDHLGVVAA